MAEKSLWERYKDDILSDNTGIKRCDQCKDCRFWGNGDDAFSNQYDKTSCDKYPYPAYKPAFVRDNEGECVFKELRE